MLTRLPAKQYLKFGTALAGFGVLVPTPALADCLINATNDTVTCTTADTNGFQSSINTLTINVTPGATVTGTTLPSAAPLLSAGTTSVVNNEGGIDVTGAPAGTVAISIGGGSRVTEASTATGSIIGAINFGAAGTGQTNTLENFLFSSVGTGITGNITSAGGTFLVTNNGTITGNINSTGTTTINNNAQSVTDPAVINGNITLGSGNDVVNNNSSGTTPGSPVANINGSVDLGSGNNTLTNTGYDANVAGTITAGSGNDTVTNTDGVLHAISLGNGTNTVNNATIHSAIAGNITLGTGNDTVINNGTTAGAGGISGNIDLGAGNNTVTNAGTITGNVTAGAGNDTLTNALATGVINGNIDLGSGTDSISNLVGTGVVTKAGTGTLTLSGNNSGFTSGGTVLNLNGGVVAIGASNNMFTGGLSFNGGTLQTTGAASLANAVTLGAGGGTVQTDAATTLSGNISGAGGLNKTGTSSLTLSGTNTFTGPATVNNGKLTLIGGSAIGDTTAVVVNTSATTAGSLQIDQAETIGSLAGSGNVLLNAGLTTGGDNTSTAYSGVISGIAPLIKTGTGTFTLTGANTYSGGTVVNNGTLAGNTTSLQGDILVTSPGTLAFNQTANGTYAGKLAGTGQVSFAGVNGATPTVLTLTGTNTGLTGPMTFASGTVAIGSVNNLGSGLLQFNGGTLQTTAALTFGNPITLNAGGGTINTGANTTASGVISGAGALTKAGSATLILTGANTYTGGTTISAGTLQGTTTSLTGNIVDNAALVIDNSANGTFAGNVTGTGSLSTINAGTTTLTGNNTYSGATNVNAGTLVVGPTGIGDSSATTVASGATLRLAANETIGSLAGAGALNGAFTLTTGGNNTSTTFSGPITATGITKVGTGTFTITGTGTPVALTVNGGTLAVGGAFTSPASVASGGTLNVLSGGALTGAVAAAAGSTTVINGTVTGNVTNAGAASGTGTVTGAFTNSATLSPGNGGPGIFHVVNGPFTQTATGSLNIDLTPSGVAGTGYDQVLVTGAPGTAVLGGTLALNPQTGVLYVAGTNYDIVNAAGGITGAFATTTGATISPFLTFNKVGATGIVTISGTNQVYRLTVNRISYATGIGASATPNQISVANGFQGLVTGATGDAATLVTAVDNMTVAQAESFFNQASPEPYGACANSLYNQGELSTRQNALQMHATPNAGSGFSVWGRGYGQWGKGRSDSFRFGSNQAVYGAALGLDYRSGGLTVGVAGGYSHDKVEYKLGNSSGHTNSWQLGGYLDYAMGPFDFDLQAA